MITKVKLSNWKSHSNTELEFLKGTNVLIGVMGAGKSAVVDAISFGLYGTFPALNSKKLGLDDCVMNKPGQKTRATIQVFFTVKGEDYSILREITVGKGTNRSELRKDDALLEGPQTKRVTEEVVRLLGMDYDLFSRAVYSEQNQMDHFLQIPSGQRKKKIDELLKINRFENARKTASSITRQLKAESKGIRSHLAQTQLPNTEKELIALQELTTKKQSLSGLLVTTKQELEQAEQETNKLETTQKKVGELKHGIKSSESKLEVYAQSQQELEKTLEQTQEKDLEKAKQKLLEVDKELGKEGSQPAKTEAEKKLVLLENQLIELQKKSVERNELLRKKQELGKEEWVKKLEQARKTREELLAKQKELEIIVTNSKQRINALAKTTEQCPVCDSHITPQKMSELETEANSVIQDSQSQLGKVTEELNKQNIHELEIKTKQLETLEARVKELVIDELSKTQEQVTQAKQRVEELGKKCVEENEKRLVLKKERDELFEEITKLEQLARDKEKLGKIISEKQRITEEISQMKKELASQEFDDQKLLETRQKTKTLSIKVGELETELKAIDALASEKQRLVNEMQQRKKEFEVMNSRANDLEQKSEAMNILKNAIENTQVQLREQFITGVNSALNMVWKEIYPYDDYPQMRLGIEKGDYSLQAHTINGDWINVEGFASGGERSTAALALRIAFSMVLAPHLSWLVLDEPTHNLDSNGIQQLSKTMRESLPELVEQIFIITHDEEMEAAVSGNLYRLERNKGEDEPTKAVLISSGKE